MVVSRVLDWDLHVCANPRPFSLEDREMQTNFIGHKKRLSITLRHCFLSSKCCEVAWPPVCCNMPLNICTDRPHLPSETVLCLTKTPQGACHYDQKSHQPSRAVPRHFPRVTYASLRCDSFLATFFLPANWQLCSTVRL